MMTIQDSVETTKQMSLFNMSIKLHDQAACEQTSEEFSDIVFDTHNSELDDSGIYPALIDLKRTTTRSSNETKIQCNMKKPIQIQLTPNSVEKLLSSKELIEQIFYGEKVPADNSKSKPIVRYNKIKEIRKLIGESSSVEFNVTKMSIHFITSMDRLLSIALFKWKSEVNAQQQPEQMAFATAIDSLVINTQNSMLLNPASLKFDCVLSQEKWNKRLLILMNFSSNGIHFQINPNDFWTFAKVQLDFWSCISRHFKINNIESDDSTNPLVNSTNSIVENLMPYKLPKSTTYNSQGNEEYFQDDLRFDRTT